MKKLIAIIILCSLLSSVAYADTDHDLYVVYNAFAKTLHAPELDKDNLNIIDNHYFFTSGKIKIIFEIPITGTIRTGFVLMDDDSETANYLSSCIAMIAFLKEYSYDYFGIVLQQFMNVRMDMPTIPYNLGTDAFQILNSDKGKYSFIYMNNDSRINE